MNATTQAQLAALRARWAGLAPRERHLLLAAGAALAALLLWLALLGPAISVLRSAPNRIQAQAVELATMRQLAEEAKALKGASPVGGPEAAAALKAATGRLGEHATLTVTGGRATLALQGVAPDALQAWLAEARAGARARPLEAQLQQTPTGWQGQLVLGLGGP
ncbi:MAG: type II secretion system protein M [Proteobacteria bacterium]|nr:type II secretion system protein M [Pseudomonadota bacterium]